MSQVRKDLTEKIRALAFQAGFHAAGFAESGVLGCPNEKINQWLAEGRHGGVFGAEMKVELVNDGPVTIIIDTKSRE